MAVSFVAGSSNSASSGTAISVSAPTGTTGGDFVVVTVHGNGQTTIADNNGATPFTEDVNDYKPNTSSGHTVSIFSRVIQSGDPTTYNYTLGATGRWSVVALTFRGQGSGNYDVSPSTGNASNHDNSDNGTVVAPSITTTVDGSIRVVAAFWDTSATGTITEPSGYTNVAEVGNQPQGVSYKVITSAGATGDQTYDNTEFAARIAISFAIKNSVSTVTVKKLAMLGVG